MGGYNPAQVMAALRATGSNDPHLLEQLQQQQQTPPPSASPVPPEVDRALETLGSSYRVPREQPAAPPPESMREREAAIPGNPYPEAPSERHYDPRMSTGRMQSQRTDLMNEQLDLAGRKGEIDAARETQRAEAAGELEARNRQGFEATQGRVEQNRSDRAALEAQAAERLAKITQLVDQGPPKPSVMSKVMGIIGTVMSVAGGNDRAQAMGRGVSMLGQSMQGDAGEWRQQVAANQAVHSQLLAAAQNEGNDSESGIAVEKGLQDLGAGVYNSALERIKAESQSEEVKRTASELQNGLLLKFTENDLQHRAKSQQGKGDDMLYRMDMDMLAEEIAAGHVGKRGQQIYQERAKASQGVRKGEAEIDASLADTAKKRRELEGGGQQEVLPGYVSTIELSPADRTAIHANAQAVSGMVNDLGELRDIRTRNGGGTWNRNDVADAERIMGQISTKLSQMNGAGAPSESERELFMKSLSDPTGFYATKEPSELYDRMAKSFRSNFEAKLKSVGIRPVAKPGADLGYNADSGKGGGERVAERGASGGW